MKRHYVLFSTWFIPIAFMVALTFILPKQDKLIKTPILSYLNASKANISSTNSTFTSLSSANITSNITSNLTSNITLPVINFEYSVVEAYNGYPAGFAAVWSCLCAFWMVPILAKVCELTLATFA